MYSHALVMVMLENKDLVLLVFYKKQILSYSRATNILNRLIKFGLVEQINIDNSQRYVISHKGIEFLQSHSDFADFAESFGMKL